MRTARLALALSCSLACGTSPGGEEDTAPATSTDPAVTTSGSSGAPDATTTDAGTTSSSTSSSTGTDPATTDPTTTGDLTSSTTAEPATDTSATTADETTGTIEEELPPIDSVEVLEAWLAGEAYKTWAVESTVHPSTGPHAGNVRTYVNNVALQSLADGNAEHPQDAATVKELYGNTMDTIIGYAVSLKTAPTSEGGATWYWYERVYDTTYGGELGTPLCTGCHGGGADYILTPYPLQ